MLFLIATYLLIVIVVPIAVTAVVRYRGLHVGRHCPTCGSDTVALLHRRLRVVSRLHPLAVLQRRWCMRCGWEGIIRLPRRQRRTAVARRAAPAEPNRATHTLDIRSLSVDGRPWRVMLQCWNHTGLFYGRLVFIAPSGRLWLDAVEAFTGSTQHEVLGQALSLPDGLLTNRLKRLVGDY